MAPCGWRLQFRQVKRLVSAQAELMEKADWLAVVIVVLGMLPVVLVAAFLFWR